MSSDRSIRSLGALRGASTSRVLNLVAVRDVHGEEAEYRSAPIFESPIMNCAIILKHRVHGDETYLFDGEQTIATKVIVPFNTRDLRLGEKSFFYGQRGFAEAMRQIGHYTGSNMDRDAQVLRLIASVPSLDPFLLREHLRLNDYAVADCYFKIAQADKARMYEFVSMDIRRLIHLACAKSGSSFSSTAKLVSALLATEVNEKLEPMRLTLMLNGNEFREGVFSWRGFLYYKWCMTSLWPDLAEVVEELKSIRPVGTLTTEQQRAIVEWKHCVIMAIMRGKQDVVAAVKTYDDAYNNLVEIGQLTSFRDFLLSAPSMFISLGEKIGAISHIVRFWKYRFCQKIVARADADELIAIFQDFESGFGSPSREQAA